MKVQKSLQSLIALSVISAILVGCSGGGSEDAANTIPRSNTTPTSSGGTKTPSPVSPSIGSGPITVGMSGTEAMDDINTKLTDIMNKQNSQDAKLNEINGNAKDAKSNSAWAKWTGIGIALAMLAQMTYNGVRVGKATGSFFKGLGGFAVNNDSEADEVYDQKREDTSLATNKKYLGAGMKWSYLQGDRGRKAAVGAVNTRMDDFESTYTETEKEAARQRSEIKKDTATTKENTEDTKKAVDATKKAVQTGNADRTQFESKAGTILSTIDQNTSSTRTSIEKNLVDMQKQLEAKNAELTKAEGALLAQASAAKTTIEAKDAEISGYKAQLDRMGEKTKDNEKAISDLSAKIEAAQKEQKTAVEKVQDLQKSYDEKAKEFDALRAQYDLQLQASNSFNGFLSLLAIKGGDGQIDNTEMAELGASIDQMQKVSPELAQTGKNLVDLVKPKKK